MKNRSWKTSLVGTILIIAGVYMYITTKQFTEPALCITMGLGLWAAKDANKSGLPQ